MNLEKIVRLMQIAYESKDWDWFDRLAEEYKMFLSERSA